MVTGNGPGAYDAALEDDVPVDGQIITAEDYDASASSGAADGQPTEEVAFFYNRIAFGF